MTPEKRETRSAILSGFAFALADLLLIVVIAVGVAAIGRQVSENAALATPPVPTPVVSSYAIRWYLGAKPAGKLVEGMRAGERCLIRSPLALDRSRRRVRFLKASIVCHR